MSLKRPVWLLSMDSEQFNAPPTTTAGLSSYYRKTGQRAGETDITLVHFQAAEEIDTWLHTWQKNDLPRAEAALEKNLAPVIGFSFYTWNAAEFLDLLNRMKALVPGALFVAGGPHVQQVEDYLGVDPLDVIFVGEAEISFREFLDCKQPSDWQQVDGLAYLEQGQLQRTPERARCRELDQFPSPLEVLQLTDEQGNPRYQSIAYETSRGCPFKCAFCEWGTGAIGSKMYQWSMSRITNDWEQIIAAGIKDIWLADSNFGALKQDIDKARLIVDLKERTGLPTSFATSWSKKHSRQVQEIALLLHHNGLLPHYQLALQTLTPEALRLSNRQNMSSNEYQPIAKHMSEQGVPIAAELIWGLPGDNLPDFERNLDQLLATFPNINIFGYTLLPGTEFYKRRDEYRIKAIPVAGYGKAKGEYVVECHSFDREQGEEGYFLISAHILAVHGHILPMTTRLLALQGDIAVSPLLRDILRALLTAFESELKDLDRDDRMAVYEERNRIYLAVLADRDKLYRVIRETLVDHHQRRALDPAPALRGLSLDAALCPRMGGESNERVAFDFQAQILFNSLAAMELPTQDATATVDLMIRHPGGVGEILHDADGGSWLRGVIEDQEATREQATSALPFVEVA
jgi:hypothetical protein